MPAPYTRTRLSQYQLKQLLEYDPQTGIFMWLLARSWRARAGDEAGSTRKDGHRVIIIDGKSYLAARLAWLYMLGSMPPGRLAFRDGDPSNIAWSNILLGSDIHKPTPRAAYQRNYRLRRRALLEGRDPRLVPYDKNDPRDPRNAELHLAWVQSELLKRRDQRP